MTKPDAVEDDKRCEAIKSDGSRCTRRPAVGCRLCEQHLKAPTDARDQALIDEAWARHSGKACPQPPIGWHCTRDVGHNGPCAAITVEDAWKP